MYCDEEVVKGPRGTYETYRAEGEMLYKQKEYRKAIGSYTTALEIREADRICLVARSKCHLRLGDIAKALEDAEASLKDDKYYPMGLSQKAEALYSMGDFEMALVFYHRGHKLRPELETFKLGIQKAREAIDNAVGSPLKVTLTKDGDLSYFNEFQRKKSKPLVSKTNRRSTGRSLSTVEEYQPTASEKTVKFLLGNLYGDKVFLERMLKETDTTSRSAQVILDIVSQTLTYLDSRMDFWRQQKPVYARQREWTEQRTEHSVLRGTPTQYLLNECQQIQILQKLGKYQESLRTVNKTLQIVKAFNVPNQDEILGNLHSLAGTAYLEMKDYEQALAHHLMDLQLAQENDLTEARSRALDNLGRVYARSGNYDSAIEVWTERLPLAVSHLEDTWLYHEIGRCHLELEQYDKALSFGQRSMSAAVEAKDNVWRLNACILMAQAEVKLSHLQKALDLFSKAKDLAKITYDYDAEKAIKKASVEVAKQLRHLILKCPSESLFKSNTSNIENLPMETELLVTTTPDIPKN